MPTQQSRSRETDLMPRIAQGRPGMVGFTYAVTMLQRCVSSTGCPDLSAVIMRRRHHILAAMRVERHPESSFQLAHCSTATAVAVMPLHLGKLVLALAGAFHAVLNTAPQYHLLDHAQLQRDNRSQSYAYLLTTRPQAQPSSGRRRASSLGERRCW